MLGFAVAQLFYAHSTDMAKPVVVFCVLLFVIDGIRLRTLAQSLQTIMVWRVIR